MSSWVKLKNQNQKINSNYIHKVVSRAEVIMLLVIVFDVMLNTKILLNMKMLLTRIFGSKCETIIPVVALIASHSLFLILVNFVKYLIDVICIRRRKKKENYLHVFGFTWSKAWKMRWWQWIELFLVYRILSQWMKILEKFYIKILCKLFSFDQ